ncbi:hypothetical protein [Cupriavidus sp. a3]|uniref:hypothetical protein n=1 Tax=Cupriavidus sp. a3 TaxID=3242158 RepID=UPI003D9C1211
MEDSLSIAGPITFARPRGAHRFEAFSPKLARRVMFYQRSAVEQWLLLEADPAVVTFCERPGYAQIEGLSLYNRFGTLPIHTSPRLREAGNRTGTVGMG